LQGTHLHQGLGKLIYFTSTSTQFSASWLLAYLHL